MEKPTAAGQKKKAKSACKSAFAAAAGAGDEEIGAEVTEYPNV